MRKISKILEVKALDSKVLAVAVEGSVGDWAVYIGAVPGHNHEVELYEVVDNGSKLSRNLAEAMFPHYKHLQWRY